MLNEWSRPSAPVKFAAYSRASSLLKKHGGLFKQRFEYPVQNPDIPPPPDLLFQGLAEGSVLRRTRAAPPPCSHHFRPHPSQIKTDHGCCDARIAVASVQEKLHTRMFSSVEKMSSVLKGFFFFPKGCLSCSVLDLLNEV